MYRYWLFLISSFANHLYNGMPQWHKAKALIISIVSARKFYVRRLVNKGQPDILNPIILSNFQRKYIIWLSLSIGSDTQTTKGVPCLWIWPLCLVSIWPLCLVSINSTCTLAMIITDLLCILVIILPLSIVAKTNSIATTANFFEVFEVWSEWYPNLLYYICSNLYINYVIGFGLEQENGRLITPMALAYPLYPTRNRSRNKRRNTWVGLCVPSWWPWFWSVNSIYHFIHITHIYYKCILSNWNKLFLRHIYTYHELVWPWQCVEWNDIIILSFVYHNMNIDTMWHCAFVICIHQIVYDCFWGVRCSGVEGDYVFLLLISTCIMMVATIIWIFMCILFISNYIFRLSECRELYFYNYAPFWTFLSLNILFEYWIKHVTVGLIYVMFRFSTRIFHRDIPGFATDCSCGV